MKSRRWGWGLALSWSLLALGLPRHGRAQAPTIEQTGMVSGGASCDYSRFDGFAVGADAGLEWHQLWHAAGSRRHAARSHRDIGAEGTDVDHDAGRDLPGATAQPKSSRRSSRARYRERHSSEPWSYPSMRRRKGLWTA